MGAGREAPGCPPSTDQHRRPPDPQGEPPICPPSSASKASGTCALIQAAAALNTLSTPAFLWRVWAVGHPLPGGGALTRPACSHLSGPAQGRWGSSGHVSSLLFSGLEYHLRVSAMMLGCGDRLPSGCRRKSLTPTSALSLHSPPQDMANLLHKYT